MSRIPGRNCGVKVPQELRSSMIKPFTDDFVSFCDSSIAAAPWIAER